MTGFAEVASPTRLVFWSLIGRTFLTLKDRPLFFFCLTAMAVLPTNLLEWWGMELANEILFSFLGTALAGSIAFSIFENLEEDEIVSPSQAISHALNWPLVVVAFILALVSTLGLVLVERHYSFLGGGILVTGLTEVFLYGLRFFMLTICIAVIPTCALEDLGPFASLQRSLELTRNHRSRVFFLLVGVNCLFVLPTSLLILGLSIACFDGVFLPTAGAYPTTLAQFFVYMLSTICTILVEACLITMYTIIYCDLREIEKSRPV